MWSWSKTRALTNGRSPTPGDARGCVVSPLKGLQGSDSPLSRSRERGAGGVRAEGQSGQARGHSSRGQGRAGQKALTLAFLALLLTACSPTPPSGPSGETAELSPVAAMRGGTAEGYALADRPRTFAFPVDHGPHPEFRTEWWYWVGQLGAEDGHRFGFQLTFFRQALVAEAEERASAWSSRDVFMGHFAVADLGREGGAGAGRFHSSERFARAAAGLAGATFDEGSGAFQVWVEDWSAEAAGAEHYPVRLRARGDGVTLDLDLVGGKDPVLQGDDGLSRKGSQPGAASYYYAMTHIDAQGTITVDATDEDEPDRSFEVEGIAWLDREWSTSGLDSGQIGWDWLALWLDDGRELMVYQMRRDDGTIDPYNHGALVSVDGVKRHLDRDQATLEAVGSWTSPRSGDTYPGGWRVSVPDEGLELEVTPLRPDQELDVAYRYWEGAVGVRGQGPDGPVTGRGYLEMVGYTSLPD